MASSSAHTYTLEDQLKAMNDLIIISVNNDDLVKYHASRASVLFQMKRWSDVITDIDFVERNTTEIHGSLVTMKWKSTIHCQMANIRESMKATIGLKILDDIEHMTLLNNISEKDIDELLNRMPRKRSAVHRTNLKNKKN